MSELRRRAEQMSLRYGMRRDASGGLYVPRGASLFVMAPVLSGKVIRQRRGIRVTDDLGVLSRKVITTAGVNWLATAFINTVEAEAANQHAMGTGAGAEAIGDTALTTEVESRVAGTQSNPSGNVYRTVATITATATRAVVEHGIFTASSGVTLWDRSIFTVINLAIGDSIQFTYNLTLTAGG